MADSKEAPCGGSVIKKCRKKVHNGDDALMCCQCELYFHIECQNISSLRYKKIVELNELQDQNETPDGIEWHCDRCRTIKMEFGAIDKRLSIIERNTKEMIENLKNDIIQQKIDFELQIKDQIEKHICKKKDDIELQTEARIEQKLNSLEEKFGRKEDEEKDSNGKVGVENTELIDQILTEKLKEEDEKKKRCNNLIIFGVKETEALDSAASSQKDREEVAKIFFQIKIKEEEIKLIRLGKKKADQKRPLLITVRNEKTK
jgi:hypothetical protein